MSLSENCLPLTLHDNKLPKASSWDLSILALYSVYEVHNLNYCCSLYINVMQMTCRSTDPLLTILTMPNCRKTSIQYQSGLMVTTCNLTLKNVNSCEWPENELVSIFRLCISVVSHYKRWTHTNILGSYRHHIYHGHSISNQPVAKWELIDLIYRCFYLCSNSESLFQMYISLVRPHLEHVSQV